MKIEFNGRRVAIWFVAAILVAPFFIPCANAIRSYFNWNKEWFDIPIFLVLWGYFHLVRKTWEFYENDENWSS